MYINEVFTVIFIRTIIYNDLSYCIVIKIDNPCEC